MTERNRFERVARASTEVPRLHRRELAAVAILTLAAFAIRLYWVEVVQSPADAVSLRSVSSDNFVVQDTTGEPRIIAEVDYDSAPSMVHEKAVYILEGRSYFVERYDHEERRAHVQKLHALQAAGLP